MLCNFICPVSPRTDPALVFSQPSLLREMLGPIVSQDTVLVGSLLKAAIGNKSHRCVDLLRSHEWNLGFHLSYQDRQGKTQKSAQRYFKTNFSIYLIRQMGFPRGFCLLFLSEVSSRWALPRWCSGKEYTCQGRRHKRRGFHPWVRKIPWRRAWQPTPVFLPGESPWTEEPCGLQSVGSQSDATEHMADTAHPYVSLWPAALWTA